MKKFEVNYIILICKDQEFIIKPEKPLLDISLEDIVEITKVWGSLIK